MPTEPVAIYTVPDPNAPVKIAFTDGTDMCLRDALAANFLTAFDRWRADKSCASDFSFVINRTQLTILFDSIKTVQRELTVG